MTVRRMTSRNHLVPVAEGLGFVRLSRHSRDRFGFSRCYKLEPSVFVQVLVCEATRDRPDDCVE